MSSRKQRAQLAGLPLFLSEKNLRMVRKSDGATSKSAADRIKPVLTPLRFAVLMAIREAGEFGLTDRELEQLPQFADRGPSTVRKRRSELFQMGLVQQAGARNRLTVWITTPGDLVP